MVHGTALLMRIEQYKKAPKELFIYWENVFVLEIFTLMFFGFIINKVTKEDNDLPSSFPDGFLVVLLFTYPFDKR